MNTKAILSQVEKLHQNAVRQGKTKINGKTYILTFNENGRYDVRKENTNDIILTFNTRSINTCKKWLREWFNN